MTDTQELLREASILSDMLRMGEHIAFGEDADIIERLVAALEAKQTDIDEALRRLNERNQAAIERAGHAARCVELESELAGCKIALEQAWESNRVRQAELDALIHDIQTYIETNGELLAENERLVRNAQTEAWLLAGYHRICEQHGIAPSSAELIAAAKEVENDL